MHYYITAKPGAVLISLEPVWRILWKGFLHQIVKRYLAYSTSFFFMSGCILRGTTSFGMLVSIFEMFWNDVCIHLHSQVQIEPWICKCRADVCGSLRSARFIQEFVYTHAHTHTCTHMPTLTHWHMQISSTPCISACLGRTACLKCDSKNH